MSGDCGEERAGERCREEMREMSLESTIAVHKDEVYVKTEKTEITHTKEAISVSAPKISLESGRLSRQS